VNLNKYIDSTIDINDILSNVSNTSDYYSVDDVRIIRDNSVIRNSLLESNEIISLSPTEITINDVDHWFMSFSSGKYTNPSGLVYILNDTQQSISEEITNTVIGETQYAGILPDDNIYSVISDNKEYTFNPSYGFINISDGTIYPNLTRTGKYYNNTVNLFQDKIEITYKKNISSHIYTGIDFNPHNFQSNVSYDVEEYNRVLIDSRIDFYLNQIGNSNSYITHDIYDTINSTYVYEGEKQNEQYLCSIVFNDYLKMKDINIFDLRKINTMTEEEYYKLNASEPFKWGIARWNGKPFQGNYTLTIDIPVKARNNIAKKVKQELINKDITFSKQYLHDEIENVVDMKINKHTVVGSHIIVNGYKTKWGGIYRNNIINYTDDDCILSDEIYNSKTGISIWSVNLDFEVWVN